MLEDLVHFDGSPGVEDVLLGRERLARLSECISLLDDQTRKILLAHRIDGLTYQEIARQHGIGITSVHRSIAKALLQIAERMEGWYP
jgi:RNA polymerase sigma-70 factor (ECF subfamily)